MDVLLFSLSKNYSNALVSCIIEETGVFLWNSGEKMHGKSQLSSISIRWCLQIYGFAVTADKATILELAKAENIAYVYTVPHQ